MNQEDHDRLVEIRDTMKDLLEEASNLVRQEGGFPYERAKAYWIGHIDSALGGGNFMEIPCTMENTIDEIAPDDSEGEEELEEEDTII